MVDVRPGTAGMHAPNFYDVLFLGAVLAGALTSRRGLAVELLPLGRWVMIVLAGAAAYEPIARFTIGLTDITFTTAAVWTYVALAVGVSMVFPGLNSPLRRSMDSCRWFGRGDQPLGMLAGGAKALAMIVAFMAVLNVGKASESQLRATARFQREAFGDLAVPTVGTVHQGAIQRSRLGAWVKEHADFLLIQPDALPSESRSIIERRNPFDDLF